MQFMRTSICSTLLLSSIGLGLVPAVATAQTNQQPKLDPALLNPASLTERAPEKFETKVITTAGPITVLVNRSWAPNDADRFYNLVKHHFYDGVLFLEVSNVYASAGRSPNEPVNLAWRKAKINTDRPQISKTRGTVCFSFDDPNIDATNFRINMDDNSALDHVNSAVFGVVIDGMSILNRLYWGYGPFPFRAAFAGKITVDLKREYPKSGEIKTIEIHEAPETATSIPPVNPVSWAPSAFPGYEFEATSIQGDLDFEGEARILTTVKNTMGGPPIQKETRYRSGLSLFHDCSFTFANVLSSYISGQLVDKTPSVFDMSDLSILDPASVKVTKVEGQLGNGVTSEATGYAISVKTVNSAEAIQTSIKLASSNSAVDRAANELSMWALKEDSAKQIAEDLKRLIETCNTIKTSAP